MARKKAFVSAVGVAVLTVSVAACTSGGTSPAKTTSSRASGVTAAQARQVFDGYVSQTASALAAGNQKAALALTRSTQSDELTAGFEIAAAGHTTVKPDLYAAPEFYLPAQNGYPRWFLASVRRTAPAGSPATLAGVPQARTGQVLMLFERGTAARSWQLASSMELQPGQQLPRLAATAGGYIPTVPLGDSTAYLARPDVAGPLQAAMVDDGPAASASAAVASGPLTTGIYAAQAAVRPPSGDVRQWSLEGSGYDTFALRTASGGAVVFYAMSLNVTTEVPAELAEASAVPPGKPIAVPADFTALLNPSSPVPRKELIVQYKLAFAATDPPAPVTGAPPAKIAVIAMGGSPYWASSS